MVLGEGGERSDGEAMARLTGQTPEVEMELDARKRADLAGPGIGTYEEVERVLPENYRSPLGPRETQEAIFEIKRHIEAGLCAELGLMMVQVPLIVTSESGVNDMLDRDGSRLPIGFHISNDGDQHPIDAEVVQAATKWKRLALRQFDMGIGEGICTDMRAVRKDYFLDHDHSAYVDQWDWELAIADKDRNLNFLREIVRRIWRVLKSAEAHAHELFPALRDRYPELPDEVEFLHAEEVLERYPGFPRKQRETKLLEGHPAVFIIGIGWTLADGYPHEIACVGLRRLVDRGHDAGREAGTRAQWGPLGVEPGDAEAP